MTNKIASEMLGYTPEEMISLNFKDIIIKEKAQIALPDMLFSDKGEMIVYNGKVVGHKYPNMHYSKIKYPYFLGRT